MQSTPLYYGISEPQSTYLQRVKYACWPARAGQGWCPLSTLTWWISELLPACEEGVRHTPPHSLASIGELQYPVYRAEGCFEYLKSAPVAMNTDQVATSIHVVLTLELTIWYSLVGICFWVSCVAGSCIDFNECSHNMSWMTTYSKYEWYSGVVVLIVYCNTVEIDKASCD